LSNRTKKPTKISKGIPFPVWCFALICFIGCVFLVTSQIQTIIMIHQQGVVAQSTIVALTPCSMYNKQPNASASQQGVLLTIRFLDERGQTDTMTFPGCQQGTYHPGDRFPVRYLPTDPTIIVQESSHLDIPEGASLALAFLSVVMVPISAVVVVGALGFLEQWRYRRLFAELHRQASSRKKV
jgi:hypothetical protein